MLTSRVQRWRRGRDYYRPVGEPLRTADYEVAVLATDTAAKQFVLRHHYSGSYPAARFRFGLFHRGELVGVAVFSHPCRDDVLTSVFPGTATDAAELGRFVLLDRLPANGETWFLARCFALLRREIVGVLSFADPCPRRNQAGDLVFPGHIGTIYQAGNGVYLGRSSVRTLRLLPDGRVFSARAAQKIRAAERGWRYSAEQLVQAGATAPAGEPRAWLRTWLPRVTRTIRHPGNHRYAWSLEGRGRSPLPRTLPYPKFIALVGATP